jgi:hypothetical protein
VRRRTAVTGIAAALWAAAGRAQPAPPAEAATTLGAPRLQGSGQLRFVGLKVYDVRLWAGERRVGGDWGAVPFALELEYLRALDGEQIAERSLKEMRRQGEIAAEAAGRWLSEMKRLFPDVKPGDRLTGLHLPGEGARFFLNGAPRGEVRDAAFARLFFGIWLAPQTSEPGLRDKLLGGSP